MIMKKIIVLVFILSLAITSQAQGNFEGIIKWNLSITSITNSSAQTELTSKQKEELNKSITELEAKINDPSMQPAFESNPSLKAMMQQQLATMKAMQGEKGISSLMPKLYTVKLKDGNSYTQIEGGAAAAAGEILYLKAMDKTYYIKKGAKTYSLAPKSTSTFSENATVMVTPTTETAKILNYTCTKYLVTFTEDGKTRRLLIWATKDLKQYSPSSFQISGLSNAANISAIRKIDGVPLKIELNEEGQTFILEVIELKSMTLPTTDFLLPADYKEVPFGQ